MTLECLYSSFEKKRNNKLTTEIVTLSKYFELKWDVRERWALVFLGECLLNVNMSAENFNKTVKSKNNRKPGTLDTLIKNILRNQNEEVIRGMASSGNQTVANTTYRIGKLGDQVSRFLDMEKKRFTHYTI